MSKKLVVVRHSGMREVSSEEVSGGLPAGPVRLFERHVDTRRFDEQVNQGDWVGQGSWLAAEAAEVHTAFSTQGAEAIHYFGMPEVPHAIAFGALVGDEYPIVIHDYDRQRHRWDWPEEGRTLDLETTGLPEGPAIKASGSVVIRFEISFPISDEDVRQVVGDDYLAEVRVRRSGSEGPEICAVRSAADLEHARFAVRRALSVLRDKIPNFELIHLFVAAPVSVCFAIGQELKPRNSAPIQTYRYRKVSQKTAYIAAIELSARMDAEAEVPLTPEEEATAKEVRSLWQTVAEELGSYAAKKRERFAGQNLQWFEQLSIAPHVGASQPFAVLSPIATIVPKAVLVSDEPVPREFGFTPDDNTWHISNRLLVGFHAAAQGDSTRLRRLIRMFLYHEYIHECHSLTKARSTGVGMFPNCLELVDYTADVYAILHVLDQEREERFLELETVSAQLVFLRGALELLVRAFWAFEPPAPVREQQVRRLRRYLNWYWRRAQLLAVDSLEQAVKLFAAAPHVEVAGLPQLVREQRHWCKLVLRPDSPQLELGVVLENLKLMRVADSPVFNLKELVAAFSKRDSGAIEQFFRKVYEDAQERGGALPA